QATPTMGGLVIVAGVILAVLLFGNLGLRSVQLALFVTVGLTLVGAVDDLVKLRTTARGISARGKLMGQMMVAGLAACALYADRSTRFDGLDVAIPFFDHIDLGLFYIPWVMVVM